MTPAIDLTSNFLTAIILQMALGNRLITRRVVVVDENNVGLACGGKLLLV
jgi:hypothetical protein